MSSDFWKNKKVAVTGGKGFLGSVIVKKLKEKNVDAWAVPSRNSYFDLLKYDSCCELANKSDIIIHCAVDGGGIGYMRENPGSVFYNNVKMNTTILNASKCFGVQKFVGVSSVCAYPKHCPIPMKEEDLWNGYPEETNAAYGLSKKVMMEMGKAYRQQYGFNSVFPLPINLYGPGDDFNLETSHVVPALIRKACDAVDNGDDKMIVWGTGSASREFLHVNDCADAIIILTEYHNSSEPINIGTGKEVKIKELVEIICDIVGFKGEIVWDDSKPDGQPRRCLDVSKMKDQYGWEAQTDLRDGIEETVRFYRKYYGK